MFPAANLGNLISRGPWPESATIVDLHSGTGADAKCWKFCEIDAAIDTYARAIPRDFEVGDRIAILAENSVGFLRAYFGVMRAGLVVVPVNLRLSPDAVAYILRDSGARLVIVDRQRRGHVPVDFPQADLDASPANWSVVPRIDASGKESAGQPVARKIAQILYTSGSTGRPKGVPLSHAGQLWALRQYRESNPHPDERKLIVAPLYHMNALFNVSLSLVNGTSVVLMPRFNARAYILAAARFRCTTLSGIPTMFALIARERALLKSLDLSSVQRINVGSAPLTEALIARIFNMFPGSAIRNGYGSTEAGPAIFGEHPDRLPRPPMSVGYPLADIEWRLDGGTSPEKGTLELKTPAMFEAYLNLPQESAKRFRDGWYVTGDVMRQDEKGFFYFVGRTDDMFVCGGENAYPGEIERMLERHPGVLQAVVVPVPDEIKGQIPIAFVVPAPGTAPTAQELKDYALGEGPAFSHPRAFVFVDGLPVSGTHKPDRTALLEPALAAARGLGR